MAPTTKTLPPRREVNHRINIINPNAHYIKRRPTCPQALEGQLHEKIARYECTSWWVCHPVPCTCPLLCIAKKDGSLRTVIDTHQRNLNTVLDVTPVPDMQAIMDCMARKNTGQKLI